MAESKANETDQTNSAPVEAKTADAAQPVEAKAPELTKPVDFLVPNQDLFERVIDQRLAAHSAFEGTNTKTSTSRSRKS